MPKIFHYTFFYNLLEEKQVLLIYTVPTRDTYNETGDKARLPAQLAGEGDKWCEKVYGEEKIIL